MIYDLLLMIFQSILNHSNDEFIITSCKFGIMVLNDYRGNF